MAFEEIIREHCLRSDMVYESNLSWVKIPENIYWEELLYGDYMNGNLIIMFPDELKDNPILKENIPKMLNVIKDYINKSQEYRRYMDCTLSVHFDSEKESFINKAYEAQKEADKLAEEMNDGISPYAWYYTGMFDGYINGVRVRAEHIIYLDDK